jgi:hypothetical protein
MQARGAGFYIPTIFFFFFFLSFSFLYHTLVEWINNLAYEYLLIRSNPINPCKIP